jgi:hypothetical protein
MSRKYVILSDSTSAQLFHYQLVCMVMDPFIPNHSFLNPKFEGYKFDPVSQEDSVICYDLEHRPTQIAISGTEESPLSFHEVQSRITHNHLAVTPEGGRAVYIDAEYKVIIIDVDLVSVAHFTRMCF